MDRLHAGHILQCPHDEDRLLLSIASNAVYVLHYSNDPAL